MCNKRNIKSWLVTTVFLSGMVGSSFAGRIITVDDDGIADFNNIQAAIDDANDSDEVVVKPGTYTGDGNRDIDFRGKAIKVRSKYGPMSCIIDCNGSEADYHRGFYFHSGEDSNSIVEGFTITGGYMIGSWPDFCGGGIYCYESSPTIRHCIIRNNISIENGGIGAWDYSDVQIYNCVFINNVATRELVGGGGGAGFQEWCNVIVKNCLFIGNHANNRGGGIFCDWYSDISMSNCTFNGNTGKNGGALSLYGSSGGVFNSILWGDNADFGPEISLEAGSEVWVDFDDVGGGQLGVGIDGGSILHWGVMNIEENPDFVTGRFGDYYLSQIAAGQAEDSPCVDWGDDFASVYGMDSLTTRTDQVTDEDLVDLGYHYPVTNVADLKGDWRVDLFDYAILASQWQGPPGVPSADIAPIGGDGVIDIDDLRVFCENWLRSLN